MIFCTQDKNAKTFFWFRLHVQLSSVTSRFSSFTVGLSLSYNGVRSYALSVRDHKIRHNTRRNRSEKRRQRKMQQQQRNCFAVNARLGPVLMIWLANKGQNTEQFFFFVFIILHSTSVDCSTVLLFVFIFVSLAIDIRQCAALLSL